MERPSYLQLLDELQLLQVLAQYEPTVIGTPPLGIDTPNSDIDIACSAEDLMSFREVVSKHFGDQTAFASSAVSFLADPAVKATFLAQGWEVELFCQSLPIAEQWGVRHFLIEQRLLEIQPELRQKIVELKMAGLKTEPAFATLLNLKGDPYEAVLELQNLSIEDLVELTAQAI